MSEQETITVNDINVLRLANLNALGQKLLKQMKDDQPVDLQELNVFLGHASEFHKQFDY